MKRLLFLIVIFTLLAGCATPVPDSPARPRVLASTTFLADIAQNVAGERLTVESLIPYGADAHSFQPRPSDAARIADSSVLILNGAEYEHSLEPIIEGAGGERLIIEASAGLEPLEFSDSGEEHAEGEDHDHAAGDPHFWLDPNLVIKYVENIRDGLSAVDPEYAETYRANAEAYIAQLQELDAWIKTQADSLPADRRIIVSNHENLAYFASRYGFTVVGAVIPSLSSEAAPSAQEMAALIETIKASSARALLLDASDNPKLANQITDEVDIKVVTDLYFESLTPPDGPAPTYIEMMKYDVIQIVAACRS